MDFKTNPNYTDFTLEKRLKSCKKSYATTVFIYNNSVAKSFIMKKIYSLKNRKNKIKVLLKNGKTIQH